MDQWGRKLEKFGSTNHMRSPKKRDPFNHDVTPEKHQQDIPEMHSVGYLSLLQVTIRIVPRMCYKVGPKKDVTGITSYNPNK